MSKPEFDDVSLTGTSKRIWDEMYTIEDRHYRLHTLFQSTIHTVVFVDELNEEWMRKDGKIICEDPMFSLQTNVNFVQCIDPTHIQMQTYERGCGMTLACGTGACASVVCAYQLGKCKDTVEVLLPKGHLKIHIDTNGDVYMTGNAQCIAKGEYVYETN